jgi:tRNA threonylcarbamoyladenosine biosynthesis protein TsaB
MPFRCLAVETATEQTSLALCDGGRLALREVRGLKAPSRTVYLLVRELLDELGLAPADLDCLAFGAGPGSFTGVRVAAALAQGLGAGLGIPVFRASTLAVLAATTLREHPASAAATAVLPVLDARMGQVYLGRYRADPVRGVVALGADRLLDPGAVSMAECAGGWGAGHGWAAHQAGLPVAVLVGLDAALLPSAQDLLRLAEPAWQAGELLPAAEALPEYLRDSVAQLPAVAG